MLKRFNSALPAVLWAALIFLLPITSLPLISKLAGGLMVAPPALVPAGLLAALWLLPRLLRRGGLPAQSVPLFWLFLAAAASSLLAFYIYVPLFRETGRLTNSLSGLATLAVGITYYLLAAAWPDTPESLRRLLRWLNWSALPLLAWALAQSAAWSILKDHYPDWMLAVQRAISASGSLYNWRATGLAYEPSWLGHQLAMLYLPWWLAAAVTRHSAHGWRILRRFTFEDLLLVLGAGVLYLSFARGALASFLLMIALLVVKAVLWLVRWLRDRLLARRPALAAKSTLRALLGAAIGLGLILVLLAGAAGAAWLYTRVDERMADLGQMLAQGIDFADMAKGLFFGERVAFWQTGLEIFSAHPLLGVGLDNAGFFFPTVMTPYNWTMSEPFKMYHSTDLPNTLSLWVRLLAETGMLGFALFAAFLYLLWQTSRPLACSTDKTLRAAGLAGQMVLLGLLMEGLSLDTFAMPYYWISLGWLTAAGNLKFQI